MRNKKLVDQAIQLMIDNPHYESVRSIVPAPITPYKMWWYEGEGESLRPLLAAPSGIKEPFNAPRQTLPQAWYQVS